jgi:hypothetical protein
VYDDDLTNLEDWLRRLKVEYGIYFNGHRKKPPDDLKVRVERLLKKLSEASNMSYPQRFRFNTLIARYYVHRDLWRRTMMERELSEGDDARFNSEPQEPDDSLVLPPDEPLEEIRVPIVDPYAEDSKVRQLYEALTRMKGRCGQQSPSMSYEQFARYIGIQTQTIQTKFQCITVVFTVSMDENAIRFTAKAGSGN